MVKKNIKKFVFILIIVIIGAFIFLPKGDKNIVLDEVSLKDSIDNPNGSFAIYVENDDGDYVEYTDSNKWPSGMILNSELSNCVDSNGNLLGNSFTYLNGIVAAYVGQTSYCYIYFDLKGSDILVTTIVDGTESSVPVTGAYIVETTTGSYWNSKTRTLNITSVSSSKNAKYTLAFTTDDSIKTNFRDYIVSLLDGGSSVTSGTGYLVDEGDAGYRYEGQNPNNYVWYNNELWRIIGVIPTITENGTENLVKIIRDESIGGYAYDGVTSNFTGVWGSNTLYTLLNSYYWGALDGTETSYCMGYQDHSSHCDFTVGGIDTTGYYGSMVEYVYWNSGASSNKVTPSTAYTNETATQTVGGYVGLMNASDYGYAYYSTDHSTSMYSYTTAAILLEDWLYQSGNTWTMTAYTGSSDALLVSSSGRVYNNYATDCGLAVRPVLYLKSADVYIADGGGSKSDPYLIEIE